MKRTIIKLNELINYNIHYEVEVNKIKNIYKLPYCEFIHIGSTAINNSYGEGIVDILVLVDNLHEITSFDEKRFNNLNYHRVSHGTKGMIQYVKITDFSTLNYNTKLFIMQKNSNIHLQFIEFYNLLSQNCDVLKNYNKFKQDNFSLKNNFKNYENKKNIFIKSTLGRLKNNE